MKQMIIQYQQHSLPFEDPLYAR